jgi:hypothetical protein
MLDTINRYRLPIAARCPENSEFSFAVAPRSGMFNSLALPPDQMGYNQARI